LEEEAEAAIAVVAVETEEAEAEAEAEEEEVLVVVVEEMVVEGDEETAVPVFTFVAGVLVVADAAATVGVVVAVAVVVDVKAEVVAERLGEVNADETVVAVVPLSEGKAMVRGTEAADDDSGDMPLALALSNCRLKRSISSSYCCFSFC
jgi:hypothetical protein